MLACLWHSNSWSTAHMMRFSCDGPEQPALDLSQFWAVCIKNFPKSGAEYHLQHSVNEGAINNFEGNK